MELLETDDAKSLLLKKSARHKKDLQDEIKVLSDNTEKIVTNALIIAGTLALTYVVISQLSKKKSKRKKAKALKVAKLVESNADEAAPDDDADGSILSRVGSAVAAQATVFLLGLAKDKLSAYLQSSFNKEAATTNERS